MTSSFTSGSVFKKLSDLRGLTYVDDDNIIGRFSQVLSLISSLKAGFKLDGNLDFNLGNLQDITQNFTLDMFSVEGIELLGTQLGTDTCIKVFHNFTLLVNSHTQDVQTVIHILMVF